MRQIAHIINPVGVGKLSALFVTQPVTFETMKIAREFGHARSEKPLIGCITITLLFLFYLRVDQDQSFDGILFN
jgi:hypothetical protein